MTYDKMYWGYRRFLATLADEASQKIVKKLICEFKACKRDSGMMTSDEDSGLTNLWDEICVQIQGEQSSFWDLYVDYIDSCILKSLPKVYTINEQKLFWLQSEEFKQWDDETDNCEENELDNYFDENNFPDTYSTNGVVDYLRGRLFEEAHHYTNAKIEYYLFGE